jgi:hypothetical protein
VTILRGKRVAGNLLLSASAVLALGMGLECGARVLRHYRGPRPTKQATGDHLEYDPLLGWRKRPSLRTTIRQWEYATPLSINSHGLRDPEREYERSPGTVRILALGDSFVEAYSVPLEESVTQILERSLKSQGLAADVINGGTAGYSTDQEYLFYESEGTKYSPQIVVLFFYYNDVLYNGVNRAFGRPKPLLKPDASGSRLTTTRYPVRRMTHAEEDASVEDRDPVEHGSAFVEWLGDRLRYSNRRAYNALAALGGWPPLPLHKGVPLEMRVYQVSPVPELDFPWKQTALILETLAHETESQGRRFLVVYVPSRLEVDDSAWAISKDFYQIDEKNWDRGRVVARLTNFGIGAGFPILDLTGIMREAGPAAYYRIDEHWNRVGHRLAAREVEGWLRRNRWLAPS